MSNISMFFKQNKTVKKNAFYPATKSLSDENGKPLEWEIKPISTKENERIQESSMIEIPIPGKPNQYRQKIKSSEYMTKLIAASVVFPDLYDAQLQDSYGVKTPEELVVEMVNDSGEWNAFIQFINQFNGFISLQEQVEEAKN
ncbi:MAG: hypothetical protein GX802_03560 [Clostridiales bacterium]|nr:hypothetical protein [Clostridiales bacterium]